MDSERITVTSSSTSLGTGLYKKVQLKQDVGASFLHVGNSSRTVPLQFNLFTIEGARNRAFDLSDWKLSGNGQVIIWKWPYNPVTPVVNTETYNPQNNFETSLDNIFTDEFLTDSISWGSTKVRAVISDEEITFGDGETQYQAIQKTGEFKISDLPNGWKAGDTLTINSTTYYANQIVEQDIYTIKFILSKQAR